MLWRGEDCGELVSVDVLLSDVRQGELSLLEPDKQKPKIRGEGGHTFVTVKHLDSVTSKGHEVPQPLVSCERVFRAGMKHAVCSSRRVKSVSCEMRVEGSVWE